ncbi:MAG: TonB family protein / TonB-dependent receptor [Myxococcaceae bacterium]|nr:TonB family protein / TonB-dependent receptor [Myxococcaceae bacterium]
MRRFVRPRTIAAIALFFPVIATAQPRVVSPRIQHFVQADFPEAERGPEARTVSVVMQLTVAADGTVSDAVVTQSGGAAFDPLAVAAARQFTFAPATVDGAPTTVRLVYRYRFRWEPPPPAPARYAGVVRGGGRPLANATVTLDSGERATTDADGRFTLDAVPVGRHAVTLSGDGFDARTVDETFTAGQGIEARYDVPMRPAPPPPSRRRANGRAPAVEEIDEVVIRAPRLRRAVVSTEISADTARRLPGTQGDVLRVVENMPGVARASVGSGQLVVWGAAPEDTRVYVDGVPVPRLYHDGGLRSVLPSDMVQSVELVPGAAGAAWGRGLGGLVAATTRTFDDAGAHGAVSADLYDAAANVRANVARGLNVAIAARRSHLAELLDASGEAVSALFPTPHYYDGQARLTWTPGARDRLELTGLLSSDRTERRNPALDPAADSHDQRSVGFERVYLRYRHQSDDGATVTVTPWFGRDGRAQLQRVGAVQTSLDSTAWVGGVRASWRRATSGWLTVEAGLDAEFSSTSLSRSGSIALPAREGDRRIFGQPPPDQVAADAWSVAQVGVAPYAEADVSLFRGAVHVLPGLRVDPYFRAVSRRSPQEGDTPAQGLFSQDFALEPRLALRVTPSARVTLKAAVGVFHQAPQPDDLSASFGAPALLTSSARHALVGAAVQITRTLTAEVTAFGSLTESLAVRSNEPSPLRAAALVSTGEGRAYGAQILVRQELARGLVGWFSYSLLRSERRSTPDALWRLSDYDQTHVLTALFSYDLGRGFEAGLRFRYATGSPRTPVASAWFDARRDRWEPVFGAQNSIRVPDFVQLDARVAKRFALGRTTLDVSLEVQNVTNQANAEELVYDPSFTRQGTISGLPLLPVLGARWAL